MKKATSGIPGQGWVLMDDDTVNNLAMAMVMLCIEIKDDLDKVKGNSFMASALHALFADKIREVLEEE